MPLRVGIPRGHWKTTTFVAGLRLTGMMAPFVLDGPMNRSVFLAYVSRVLVSELNPGDIVILDNVRLTRAAECARRSSGWGRPPLPSALQPGLQPHRKRLREAQSPAAQGR
jgi:hypothetical protein